MMRAICSLALFAVAAAAQHAPAGVAPEKALARLMEGNRRHVQHRERHPDMEVKRRHELATSGQHPFAIIIGCADSRVPPELVFDQGLGDMFVIRDAGNVVDEGILGSIEYAVEHLGVRLVMVLGHEKCGAVSAAIAGGEAHGHVKVVVDAIQPAVEESAKEPGDKVHNCVVANARRTARLIRESEPVLKSLASSGRNLVVAADYDLYSGKVELLDLPAKTVSRR
ncbi:MAG: carbonic anhydrase [Bryobacteraceae bacterium]|nr:carbonic anhydrase [Bryobacteraceae bacterium]